MTTDTQTSTPTTCACEHTTWQIIDTARCQCLKCGRQAFFHDVPSLSQPPASADSKDEEIARLKECLFQMQEAAKGLASASFDPKGQAGAAKPPALGKQEGGSHYKDCAIQPVEFIHANKLPFLEACVVKRICRHRRKNGAQDIRKAIHELELILALDYPEETTRHPSCPD